MDAYTTASTGGEVQGRLPACLLVWVPHTGWENCMRRTTFGTFWLVALLLLQAVSDIAHAATPTPRIVVFSDVHYTATPAATPDSGQDNDTPDALAAGKRALQAVRDVNAWDDVSLVAVTGDIVARYGTVQEYDDAATFVNAIAKPRALVAGNHEFAYADGPASGSRFPRGDGALQQEKLRRFMTRLATPETTYAMTLGGYLLVFLSPEVTGGPFLTELSASQLQRLDQTLRDNAARPAIIFFHAPLKDTLLPYSPPINGPQRIAQPEAPLRKVLLAHPQVVAWVSGHTHTRPGNASFRNDVNRYHGRITNIHIPDMTHRTAWSTSLYLHPDKLVVRLWDHTRHAWVPEGEAVIPLQR